MRPAALTTCAAALVLCLFTLVAAGQDISSPTPPAPLPTFEELAGIVIRLRAAVKKLKHELNDTQLQLNATSFTLANTQSQLEATKVDLASTLSLLNDTRIELAAAQDQLDSLTGEPSGTVTTSSINFNDSSSGGNWNDNTFNYETPNQGNATFDRIRIGEWYLEPEADKLVLRYNGTGRRAFYNGKRFVFAPNGDIWSGLFPRPDGIGYGDWVIHRLGEKWNFLVLNNSDASFRSVRIGDYVMKVADSIPQYIGFYLYGKKLLQLADNGDIWSALFPQPGLDKLDSGDWMVSRLREHWNRLAFSALCDKDVFQVAPTLDSARCFDFGSRGRTLCSNDWSKVQLVRGQQY